MSLRTITTNVSRSQFLDFSHNLDFLLFPASFYKKWIIRRWKFSFD